MIRIEHQDGSTDTIPHTRVEIENKDQDTKKARLYTFEEEVNNITLEENQDEVFYVENNTDEFGGVLNDVTKTGEETELYIKSFEQYAQDTKPINSSEYAGVQDTTIIQDAIDEIPELTAGTLENVKGGLTFIFTRAKPAEIIQVVEGVTGADVVYNADKTVDYVSNAGTSRSTTLSPSNQNLVNSLSVRDVGGDDKITHLQVLGASEGDQQRLATVVPDADTSSYENKYTYTSNWEVGDRKIWDTVSNKQQIDIDTLAEEGIEIIKNRNKELTEITTTVNNINPINLYDTVPVQIPERNIDATYTVLERTRQITENGEVFELLLSTRKRKQAYDRSQTKAGVESFQKDFQGTLNHFEAGHDRKPVDGSHNYKLEFYYPSDVKYENKVDLRIKGLNYRSYASGSGHTHDVTVSHPSHTHSVDVNHPSHTHDVTHPSHNHTVTHPSHTHDVNHPSHTHDVTHPSHDHSISTISSENTEYGAPSSLYGTESVTLEPSYKTYETFSPNIATSELIVLPIINPGVSGTIYGRLYDATDNVYYPNSGGYGGFTVDSDQTVSLTFYIPKNFINHTLEFQARADSLVGADITHQFKATERHTHDVSDTSTAALGTTETSTAALGTTETSTSALGQNETSSTELGTTETSTSALGTTTAETSNAALGTTTAETSGSSVGFQPGINDWDGQDQSPAYYPEDIEVIVNNSNLGSPNFTSGTDDGTQEFEATMDLIDDLNTGAWNQIEITSASLGHIDAAVVADHYRQIINP